ncbi:hypothetical protein F511_28315 [Dorcoceras hygrometricum]|uniref:Uncharacterized protein n=1 Tax=Dorcoceras hygrometricum TaxID=472368 RepID=A0A2Z7AYG2_9LAMI|nr:hypothetical protein F511_28315 [Dorcoceras hygrometricum]
MWDTGPVELLFMYYELMDPCVHGMVKRQHRGVRDPDVCSFVFIHSFSHTLAHSYICSRSLARASSDLSIGGASPDTLSAPSDECFVVADIQAYSPVPDARRARGPRRGVSSRLNYLATSDIVITSTVISNPRGP